MPLKLALGLLLACLLPATAVAEAGDDYARPGVYLGVGGTYAFHWFPGSFDRDAGAVPTRTDDTGGVNARVGYRALSWLAAELEYEWLDGFDNEIGPGGGLGDFTLTTHTITANGKFLYPGWGRFQPYALLGAGVSIWDVNDRSGLGSFLDDDAVGFAGRVGAGLDTYLTPHWLVNLSVESVFTTTRIDNSNPGGGDLKNLFYVPIQLGIQYRF